MHGDYFAVCPQLLPRLHYWSQWRKLPARKVRTWNPASKAPIHFGEITPNGLQTALYIDQVSTTNDLAFGCTPILRNTATNVLWIYLPPVNNRFRLMLLDDHGNVVPMTDKGKQLGGTITEPFRVVTGINTRAGYTGCPPLQENHAEMLAGSKFSLHDYFYIKKPGNYLLRFQMLVIWFPPTWKGAIPQGTNVPVVALPPVQAQIKLNSPR